MNTTETLDVVVVQRELQAEAVAVLTLADPTGRPLPAFTAGAHIDVHLPGSLIRQYSLCSDPRDQASYRLAVLRDRDSRGGSIAVHEALLPGTALTISVPRNHFPLAASEHHAVLVGGGIGITPMIAMAWELHAAGRSFELHYCARSRAQAALLQELADAPWAARVTLHFDDEGSVLVPARVFAQAPAGRHVYVCGPAGFMEWVMAEARTAGLAPEQIHREYFAAPVQGSDTPDTGFEVVARASGKTVQVAPGQTILEALRSVGIKVPVSCEEGVCGTCLCNVLEGEPDHRDAYLTDEEKADGDQILVCCSRSKSPRLVLDL